MKIEILMRLDYEFFHSSSDSDDGFALKFIMMQQNAQYSTAQYSTVQYSTVQYSTVQYSTVQYSTEQISDSTVQ